MPVAKNGNIKIHYEVFGKGSPLVLAHGLTGSVKSWKDAGYIDSLKNDFQLIAFDARGHGQSDKPHKTSDYGLKMVEDVISVLDDMGLSKANYFGYSMGARIGFRVATRHANRFYSFILGAVSPYRSEAESKVEMDIIEEMKTLLSNPEAGILLREKRTGHTMTSEEKKALLANDLQALIADASAFRDLKPLTNKELSLISVPCLLFCGTLDPRYPGAMESAKHIPKAKFISLPGINHGQGFERSDLSVPHIKEFLSR